ncbi:MAG: hypothetical protein LIP28_02170 [Deltaproteobacteria bacterium]|nr:hypothetical protein [Deltaproteobacteria bacterium]
MSDSIPRPPASGPGNPADGDQYREYYIPANIVREEKELLDEYETDRFAHALREIYTDFYLMIELMRGYAEGKDDEDFTYFLLAQKLQLPLDRLSKACSVVVDWQLVMRRTIGVELNA